MRYVLALVVVALVGCAERAIGAEPSVRAEFVTAMERVRSHLPDLPDSAALQSYAIHDYLIAARLQRDLEASPTSELDSSIDRFLEAHTGQPVGRNLQGEWLASLAVRARWDWFLPRTLDTTTPLLACDRLAGRLATGDLRGLSADALNRWSQPQKQPPECDPVFAWLRAQKALTPEAAEARARAALLADNPRLAREAADDVPADRASPLLQWAQLLEKPKTTLEALASNPSMVVESSALEAGFTRLARTDSSEATSILPRLLARPDVAPDLATRLQRLAALGAAYDHAPTALDAFRRLSADAVNADVQEWRARAALWAGDYGTALNWIEQMPGSLSAMPRWRYWRARAREVVAGKDAAKPLYAQIAGLRDFYGYLAADRVHVDYALNAHPLGSDPAVQARLEDDPGLVRAHELFSCGMTEEALAEWSSALSHAPPPVRAQAALLADRWGWYMESISTLAQLGELDDVRLRYPRPYAAAIATASKLTQLPEDWILAVMRQESLFRPDAVSRAGARGLMQMQPSTAAAVARRWHLAPPRTSPDSTLTLPSVTDAAVAGPDIQLGAAYLREQLDRFSGQLGPSLAAYNAGPIPIMRWLPPRPLDADVWIENIPYGETRGYVQRILEHIVAFAWVRNATPPRLAGLLPSVEPTGFYARVPD